MLANINRNPKKKPRPFKAQDFIPLLSEKRPGRVMPEAELKTQMRLFNAALGGTEVKK